MFRAITSFVPKKHRALGLVSFVPKPNARINESHHQKMTSRSIVMLTDPDVDDQIGRTIQEIIINRSREKQSHAVTVA